MRFMPPRRWIPFTLDSKIRTVGFIQALNEQNTMDYQLFPPLEYHVMPTMRHFEGASAKGNEFASFPKGEHGL